MTAPARMSDIHQSISHRTLAFKIPNIVNRLGDLKQCYPGIHCVSTIRHPDEVVRSTIQRGWYRDATISYSSSGSLRETAKGRVPAYIQEADAGRWLALSEADRCYDFFCQVYALEYLNPSVLVVDFEGFCNEPYHVASELAEQIGVSFGEKTKELLDSVKVPVTHGSGLPDHSGAIRDRAIELYHEWKHQRL